MHEFKIGDTVQLKSGGPVMTIDNVTGARALCIWFQSNETKPDWFHLSAVEKAELALA